MKFRHNILIIGGMGPQASLKLHEHILTKAIDNGAENADDFPTITHLSLPFEDFICDPKKRISALEIIKEHLYYLWRFEFYTRYFSVQYSASITS